MFSIRALIIGLPLLLCAVFVATFVSEKTLAPQRKNQLIHGSIGEPHNLNPIQDADASAGEVQGFLCNGLVKYDENLEVTGDLAESWEESQTTTIFFADDIAARAASATLDSGRAQWNEWMLQSAEPRGAELRLRFSKPGPRFSRAVFELLDRTHVQPVAIIRAEMKDGVHKAAEDFSKNNPLAIRIQRTWFESDSAVEFSVTGDAKKFSDELQSFLQSRFAGDPHKNSPKNSDNNSAQNPNDLQVSVTETHDYLDEPEILFHMRKNVRWHDGAPCTAHDAEFTFRMIEDPTVASPRKPDYDLFQTVEALDDFTLHVVCRKPYSLALQKWMMALLPAHILEGKSTEWWAENFNRHLIGTGPFKFAEWKTNEYILLKKNPDYFAGAPHLDSILIRTLPDPLTLRLAFETRQIDFWGAQPWSIGTFARDPRFQMFAQEGNSYDYIGWNLRRPLFQDVKVRQALAHAVNVGAMIQYVLYGNGQQSTGIFPQRMWFFNADVKPFNYDPELAKKMLAEAGWQPGSDGILTKNGERFSFTLMTNNGNEIRKDIATLVQADLRKIGIEVKVEIYEWAVFLDKHVDTADFDAVVLGWALDVDYDQYQIWHSSQTHPKQLNFVGYKNPKVDKLLDDIRVEYDRDRIKAIAGELQQTIYEDQPYLFLDVPKATTLVWKDTLRVLRPEANGEWKDEPLRMTKAGVGAYQEWFYRPEYKPNLKAR